jgi:hypothetical protein
LEFIEPLLISILLVSIILLSSFHFYVM